MNKIIQYKQLKSFLKQPKLYLNRLVLVGGCFDILHLGHIRFLKAAKKYGQVLVALESDEALTKHKGHLRPIHKQAERAEVLSNLETVNYVLLLPHFTSDQDYFNLVEIIKPQVVAITEGDSQLLNKQKQADEVSAKLIVVPKISTPSTTQLIKLLKLE